MRNREGGQEGRVPLPASPSSLSTPNNCRQTLALHELLHHKKRMWSSQQAWLRPGPRFLTPLAN